MYNNTEKRLVHKLIKEKKTVSVAESCTSGLIASMIGNIPGASEIFNESYVTYSNESKMKLLGVKEETLALYGAVSHQTAIEMAEGVREASGCDIAISVTGIAGPGGGTDEKPVGLVYIGISTKDKARAYKHIFKGCRNKVRYKTAKTALKYAISVLKEEK